MDNIYRKNFLDKNSYKCDNGDFAHILWVKKKRNILERAFSAGMLSEVVAKFPPLKSMYARCEKNGTLSSELCVKFFQIMRTQSYGMEELLCFMGYEACHDMYEGVTQHAWEIFYAMYCVGVTWGLDPRCYPNVRELNRALENGEEEALLKRFETAVPYCRALLSLQRFKAVSTTFLESVNHTLEEVKKLKPSSLEELAGLQQPMASVHTARRSFRSEMKKVRTVLTVVSDGKTERLVQCMNTSEQEFACLLEKHLKDVQEELIRACAEVMPKRFDAKALHSLLHSITPPLNEEDMHIAEKEISDLDSGILSMEDSPLLSTILPVLRGERKLDYAQLQSVAMLAQYRYSFIMLINLLNKEYVLSEQEARPFEEEEQGEKIRPSAEDGAECSVTPLEAGEKEEIAVEFPGEELDGMSASNEGKKGASASEPEVTGEVAAEEPRSVVEAGETFGTEEAMDSRPVDEFVSGTDEEKDDDMALSSEEPDAADEPSSPAPGERGEDAAHAEVAELPGKGPDEKVESDASPVPAEGSQTEENVSDEEEIDYQQFACEHLEESQKPRIIRPASGMSSKKEATPPQNSRYKNPSGKDTYSLGLAEWQRIAQGGNMGPLGRKLRVSMPDCPVDFENAEGGEQPVRDDGEEDEGVAARPSPEFCSSLLDKGLAAVIAGKEGVSFPSDDAADMKDRVDELIVQKDTCGLYWLARTMGEHFSLPVWLAELLHLGTHLLPGFTQSRARISELCDEAVNAVQDLGEKNSLLLAAAILRPAFMMPEASMITITSSLSSTLRGYQCASVLTDLRSFISQGKPMDDAVFLGKTTEWQRSRVKEALTNETEEMLDRLSKGKLSYQPATQLRKKLFNSRGDVGRFLYNCLRGESLGLDEFIERYSDPRNIEALIERKIKADARQKLLADVRMSVELLKRWRDFFQNAEVDLSYAEMRLSGMYQAMSNEERLSASAEGQLLLEQMGFLYRHELTEEPCDPLEYLRLWPLRIAGSFQTEEKVFDLPRLFFALHRREFEQPEVVAASLVLHMAAGRLDEVKDFLNVFAEYGDKEPDRSVLEAAAPTLAAALPFTLSEVMNRSRELWEREFVSRIDKLNVYIGDCYFRGAIHYGQQGQSNARCSGICKRYSDVLNKAPAMREIQRLYDDLKRWDDDRLEDVRRRVKELRIQAAGVENALEFLDRIEREVEENRVYSAAWDSIARLEDFLISRRGELPVEQDRNVVEASAARAFYKLLEQGPVQVPVKGMEVWHEALSLRRERIVGGRYTAIITELLRWLGFALDVKAQAEEVFTTRAPHYWRIFHYPMDMGSSPLPQWGSGAHHEHTIVLGWDAAASDIASLMTNGYIKEGEAVTVICFGELKAEERKKALSLGRNWPSFPLIVDSNLMAFLARQDGEKRTKTLFEVALAGAPCNPYTPDVAGAVPREMFFGREEDRKGVLAPEGSCIIYGGRQLGKSALLQQIYQYNNDENKKVLLHTMRRQETSILDVILGECIKEGIVGRNTTRKTFHDNLITWLEAPGRRLLVLLDECDAVLDEDARHKFADVEEVRNIMQMTSRRFKVVFTGLHSVQRFSHVPNLPLYHFGEPICIGPLSTEAAYDLMTKPMAVLGLEFETPQLVQMALNHCNYQPKIIQMFCSELVEAIERDPFREPLYVINKATMLKVYESQNLKKKIRDCFNMTLNLDPRYLVIGYTMALQQDEDMTLNELLTELRCFWPAAFSSGNDVHTLQSLLHEMEGLGLVISLGGSYRLRTPNVVELLGGQENVLQELEQYAFRPYQPEGDPDELRIRGADVFVATQYNLLADKASRLSWVSGSSALGVESVPDALENIVKATSESTNSTFKCFKITGRDVYEAMGNMSRVYENRKEGGMLFMISSSEFPYMGRFMEAAENWLNRLRTGKKFVKIVCIVGPETLYDFIKTGESERFSSYQLPLIPWTENSVERWSREYAVPLNAHEIMQRTSGWPLLVQGELGIRKENLRYQLKKKGCFMPDAPELKVILDTLKDLGDESYTEDEILDLVDWHGKEAETLLRQGISLLSELHVLREKGKKLSLDRVVAEALQEVEA